MNAPNGGTGGATALADFILLNEEIAALIRARLPLESRLARMGANLPGTAAELAQRIGRRLEDGEALPAAMDAECVGMPAAYRAVILAGVESGELGAALESLVETTTRIDQLRRVTGLAFLYPLFIAILFCLLLAMMLGVVIPQFGWLNHRHFWPLDRLAAVPGVVETFAIVVPCAILLSAGVWWLRARRLGGSSAPAFGFLWRLPGLRRVHQWGQAAILADLLRLLLARGVPLDRALRVAADAAGSPRARAVAEELAQQAGQGAAVSSAISTATDGAGEFPTLIRLALRHAADRKRLEASLLQAAEIYRDRAIRAAEWYAEAMPIVLTAGIGGALTIVFTLLVIWPYASSLHELASWNWR